MKEKFFKIENKKTFYFSIVLISYELLYWIIMAFTKGNLISTYFITDLNNTSMDYFNMLANMQYDTPYIYHSNYPAMCFLFWKIMYAMIPHTGNIVDGFFLRNYMPAQLGYLLLIVLSAILFWELFHSFRTGGKFENGLLAVGLIMSGPMLFAYERGNIIILAFLFLIFFILFYDSSKKSLRMTAYICLAIAASLKLYPALFGILVLQRKRYKEAALLVLFGLLFFFVPFFAFDGLQSIKDMLEGMSMATSNQMTLGIGVNFSFNNLMAVFHEICSMGTGHATVLPKIISAVCMVFAYFWTGRNWQKVFLLSLLCVWLPKVSYSYVLILFILPFLFYLREEKDNNSYLTYLYGILFVVILIPMALPFIGDADKVKFPLTWSTVIINMALLLISTLILLESLNNAGISKILKKYGGK